MQWLLHLAVVLLAVYWAITLIEGAQFWGLVGLRKQGPPELVLAVGYGLLAFGTHWLISYHRPRLSQLRADQQALIIYLWRSYLIPFIPMLALPIAYEILRQGPIYLVKDLPGLLLMSLILLMLFSLVNQLELARYFLAVNARAGAIAVRQRAKTTLSIAATTVLDGRKMLVVPTTSAGKSSQDLLAYIAFCLQDRRVIAYDEQGQAAPLKFRTLAEVKRKLQGDERFFMKGSWILRYDALDRQELMPETRARKLYLKYTSNYFVLNKNDAGQFSVWLESNKQLKNPGDGKP